MKIIQSLPPTFIAYFIFFITAIFIAPLSFSVDDGGYLYGLGWRILTGEVIYHDFIYARTPLSPFLNAFIQYLTPDQYEYLLMRILFFGMILTYSILSIKLLLQYTTYKITKTTAAVLYALAFSFNIHTNNYMWHTVDGLFFAMIGAYLIFNKKNIKNKITLGLFFIVAAVLAKQSFFPVLVSVLIIIAIWDFREDNIRLKKLPMAVAIVAGTVIAIFLALGIDAKLMLGQVAAASGVTDFIDAGVLEYLLKGSVFLAFLIPIASIIFFKIAPQVFNSDEKTQHIIAFLAAGSLLMKPVLLMFLGFFDVKFFPSMLHMSLLFDIVLIFAYLTTNGLFVHIKGAGMFSGNDTRFSEKNIWMLMLVMSWASSISWGYKTPIFFSGVLIFMLTIIVMRDRLFTAYTRMIISSLTIMVPLWVLANYYISNSRHLLWPTSDKELNFISQKLDGIYVNDEKELKNIKSIVKQAQLCEWTYAVKYSHTYIHYALSDFNLVQLDWISDAEAIGRNTDINAQLDRVDCVIEDPEYRFLKHKKFGWTEDRISEL